MPPASWFFYRPLSIDAHRIARETPRKLNLLGMSAGPDGDSDAARLARC
jgi:hypothetical protein